MVPGLDPARLSHPKSGRFVLRKRFWAFSSVSAFFVLIILLLTTNPREDSVGYSISDLGACSLWDSWDLNDRGQIVMTKRPAAETWSTFLIEPDGNRNEIWLRNRYVFGTGLNNKGEIVGYTRDKTRTLSKDMGGFVWSPNEGFSFVSEMNFVNGVNDQGEAVGGYYDDENNHVPCLLNKDKELKEYQDEMGGINASLQDINTRGSFIGSSYINGKGHVAKVWEATGDGTDIPALGKHGVSVNAIDDHGQILCSSSDLTDLKNAFLGLSDWVKSGFKKKLDLQTYRPGVSRKIFIWEDGEMNDLEKALPSLSGWKIFWAQGIDNKGEIIGTGYYRGSPHAFLLTPIRGSFGE